MCGLLVLFKQIAQMVSVERTLSENEARVVLDLEWRGQKTVTLADVQEALDATDGYARYIAHRLVKKGWLERLRPGLFQLVPAERGREGVADTHPLSAGAVLIEPYFFSFGTACTHHRLTEQSFSEVYIACRVRRRPETIRGKRYVFVRLPSKRYFGDEETRVLGQVVRMATMERALLDALDRPRYAGGIGEVSRMVERGAERVSWERLLDFAERWQQSAIVQRLGHLLEVHGADVPRAARDRLLGLVSPKSNVHLGGRRKWGTSGELARPWNVIRNVPDEVLLEARVQGRRRVSFGPGSKKR